MCAGRSPIVAGSMRSFDVALLDELYSLDASETRERFKELCKNPLKTQESVLKGILKNADKSRFFKEYSLSVNDDINSFRGKVKLSSWEEYEECSGLMQEGEENLLFNGRPEMFTVTSGTSAYPKLIPETQNSLKAKAITEKLKRFFLLVFNKEILNGTVFPLVNRAVLGKTPCGIPYGTASGITLADTPQHLKRFIAFPVEIISIEDEFSVDYLMMRFAIESDVRLIIGNNLARMEKLVNVAKEYAKEICDDIEKGTIASFVRVDDNLRQQLEAGLKPNEGRAQELRTILEKDEFLPFNYWKNLKTISCWISGSVGIAAESARRLFSKDTIYFDFGYGASEGKFNIPYKPQTPSGILAIHAAFYEFIPVNGEKALLAHEVKKGELYRLVITTYSGLYRYDMKDIVKVTGFFEGTPEIEFVSKTGDIGNMVGEKLSASTLKNTMFWVAQELGLSVNHFCAVKVKKPPHYVFCVELKDGAKFDRDEFLSLLDKKLREDIGYGNRRREGILKDPQLKIMKPGWKEALYKKKQRNGLTEAQIKLPIFYDEIPHIEFVLE